MPQLDEFLSKRDYAGAISLLEFQRDNQKSDDVSNLWLAHCAFHANDYKKASEVYLKMLKDSNCPTDVNIYVACCYFFLGLYNQASEILEKSKIADIKNALKTRLSFHLSYRMNDENRLMHYHSQLQDTVEDQLSLASMHFLRYHYQQSIDIYKKILSENSTYKALNVYMALCYHKLDCYDVSLEVLQCYLNDFPDSATAINLKACNQYKLYNGSVAEKELRAVQNRQFTKFSITKRLIQHNSVVFRDGDAALQVLPSMINAVPEARLNLIIFHLRRDDLQAASQLANEMNAQQPSEMLLKAITSCCVGYQRKSKEHLKIAEEHFRIVGELPSECDTIVGRQAMASALFLSNNFDEVVVYLNSIKAYFYNDDVFNFNMGQALLTCGNAAEAETCFLLISSPEIKEEWTFKLILCTTYVRNGKAHLAWEMLTNIKQSDERIALLRIIANDCYKLSDYYHAAIAFDAMERIEPNPKNLEGLRGSVVGVFKLVAEHKESPEHLREVLLLLESNRHPEVDHIAGVIRRFCRQNRIDI